MLRVEITVITGHKCLFKSNEIRDGISEKPVHVLAFSTDKGVVVAGAKNVEYIKCS